MASPTITCPVCDETFPISDALAGDIEDKLRQEWNKDAEKERQKSEAEFEKRIEVEVEAAASGAAKEAQSEVADLEKKLEAQEKQLEKDKKTFDQRIQEETQRIKEEEVDAAKKLFTEELYDLKKKARDRAKEIKELKQAGKEIEAKTKDIEAREEKLEEAIAQKVKKAVAKAERIASDETAEEYETQIMRQDKKLGDLRKQVTELKRQLEQSSQQLQGEVYELHLEKLLQSAFPEDEIVEVAKGQAGADIIQQVFTKGGILAGKIIWESKDTKTFYKKWLTKLKTDQRKAKAEIAIIATTALPKDFQSRFGQIDGIWVTDFAHAVVLAVAIREHLIQLHSLRLASVGKEENLEVIYQYLTGVEFKHRVEAIVEAFAAMQDDLNRERLATERNWSKREKQLQAVLTNVAGMYGDFQGIAGKTLPKIKKLELLPASAGE